MDRPRCPSQLTPLRMSYFGAVLGKVGEPGEGPGDPWRSREEGLSMGGPERRSCSAVILQGPGWHLTEQSHVTRTSGVPLRCSPALGDTMKVQAPGPSLLLLHSRSGHPQPSPRPQVPSSTPPTPHLFTQQASQLSQTCPWQPLGPVGSAAS